MLPTNSHALGFHKWGIEIRLGELGVKKGKEVHVNIGIGSGPKQRIASNVELAVFAGVLLNVISLDWWRP